MPKFMGKNPHKKYVRQLPNRSMGHFVVKSKKIEENVINAQNKTKENNTIKNNDNMADERLKKIEEITGSKAPKRKVRVEKKDKGLLERADDSTILLTEDNKMLLND